MPSRRRDIFGTARIPTHTRNITLTLPAPDVTLPGIIASVFSKVWYAPSIIVGGMALLSSLLFPVDTVLLAIPIRVWFTTVISSLLYGLWQLERCIARKRK